MVDMVDYDSSTPIKLSVDSSVYAIGAVSSF